VGLRNAKISLKTGCNGENCTHLVQDEEPHEAAVNAVMNLRAS
jgi:hypothetical protein